jgi:hypothetical protein
MKMKEKDNKRNYIENRVPLTSANRRRFITSSGIAIGE